MKKVWISLIAVVVIVAVWLMTGGKKEVNDSVATPTLLPSPTVTQAPSPISERQSNTVIYTDLGYSPNPITIKKGQTVVWKNESSKKMWTASAMHPTHKIYPGTDIALCGMPTFAPMFDSCNGISFSQSWSFKFVSVGTWKYHNHMNPTHYGTVIVE